jgi:hypothetical protein
MDDITIIAWQNEDCFGIIKYNDIISMTNSASYDKLKNITSYFNEEKILNIDDISLEYLNLKINSKEEYDKFIEEKKKL